MCGLRHEAIQRRLLSEVELTYAKAMEIAGAMEAANRDAKAFKSAESTLKKLHSQTKGKEPSRVSGATGQATVLLSANSRRQNVMPVVRKATLLQPAGRRTRVLPSRQTSQGRAILVGSSIKLIRSTLKRETPAVTSISYTSSARTQPLSEYLL